VHEILEQTEPEDRKPVPRAVPAKEKPEYLVKAINDEPAADDDSASSNTSQSASQNSKHD
jgi:hypothetical protein